MQTKESRVTGGYDAVYLPQYPELPVPDGYDKHKPLPEFPFFVDVSKLSDEELEELRQEYNR